MNSKEIKILVLFVFLIVMLFGFVSFYKKDAQESDSKKFIQEDLRTKYPSADIEIISVSEKSNDRGEKYFTIKAKVTNNFGGRCPERIHIYYNYPEQNFVPQTPEYITRGCVVCQETRCVIAFPEEAIIASHTFRGTEEISNYLREYLAVSSSVQKLPKSWLVSWNSDSANYYYTCEISNEGKIISVKRLAKS